MQASNDLVSTPPQRLHGLDALRGIALLLGLVVHASMAFLPGAQYFWITHDPQPSAALGLAFYVPHMFRMVLFFLIAGFFGRLALQRIGTRTFIKDRWKRITRILLIGWPLVFAGIIAALTLGALWDGDGSLPKQTPPPPKFTPDSFPLTHLWFLYVLTLCYAAMLVLRALLERIDRRGWLATMADRVVRLLSTAIGPALLALPLAAALYAIPAWYHWFGIPTPDQSLYPNLAASVAFGSAFVFGWWLQRQIELLHQWTRHWPLHLGIAIAATVTCLYWVGLSSPPTPAAHDLHTLGYAFVYGWASWSWTYALVGMSLRFLSSHSPVRRYLADASYWIYLAHIPLVMALQVVACRLPGPAVLKFIAVLAISFALLLLSYRWFVRGTFIGVMLNGKRLGESGTG